MTAVIDDDDVRNAPLSGLWRLAAWLKLDVEPKRHETPREYRWRLGRAIQREEKRLARAPKQK